MGITMGLPKVYLMLVFLGLIGWCSAETISIDLYRSLVSSKERNVWGAIEYDTERRKAKFEVQDPEFKAPHGYCVGTAKHNCIAYLEGDANEISLFVDRQGNVKGLGVRASSGTETPSSTPQVKVITSGAGPVPNRSPAVAPQGANAPKKPTTEKIVQTKIVKETDEDGNEIEVEVEEEVEVEIDDRSFIQKNWIYITLPLLFLMLAGGDSK